MKRFELLVTRDSVEIYKAIFSFTKEQEKQFFKKIKMISQEGNEKGIDTSDIEGHTALNPDIVIMATLRTQCRPLFDSVVAFEENMKSWGTLLEVTASNFGEIRCDCKRIAHLKVIS
jgi:hypothetical protein